MCERLFCTRKFHSLQTFYKFQRTSSEYAHAFFKFIALSPSVPTNYLIEAIVLYHGQQTFFRGSALASAALGAAATSAAFAPAIRQASGRRTPAHSIIAGS